jgi:hypothetical protein
VDTRCPGSLFKSRACFTRKALGAPASALHDIFHSDLPESFCRPVLGVAKRFLQLLYCASSRRMIEIGVSPVSRLSMRVMRASCTVPFRSFRTLDHPSRTSNPPR